MTESHPPEKTGNSMEHPPSWLKISSTILQKLSDKKPVVALESTVTTHGLPKPVNLDLANQMEEQIRSVEVEPATIALIQGQVCVGLSADEMEGLALATDVHKISIRDLGAAISKGQSGGTTVAATMNISHRVGINIFATGGIGGVHRGDSGDISTDLFELSRTPVAVICSGAKAILDLPRTLEWLETVGVPVIGWQTDEFPAFFSQTSGLGLNLRADNVSEIVDLLNAHWSLGFGGALICVPCPEDAGVPLDVVEAILEVALMEAEKGAIRGKELTPFLLNEMSELSSGATLRANLSLLRNNALVAAQIANAMAD
jgi:pseudouridine-5'-phosphate glycosidase